MLDMISIFLNLQRLDLWPSMWSILENVLCTLEKTVCILLFLGGISYIYLLNSFVLMCHLSQVSLLTFCLDILFIDVCGVLKSPTIIVLLSISPLYLLMFALCIEVLLCWVHKYLQLLYLPLGSIPWSLYSVLLCLL